MRTNLSRRRLLLTSLAIPVVGVILILSVRQLPGIGGADFRAYWSTSYLLSQGQDCSNDELLRDIQYRETGWRLDNAMRIWNPPWVYSWFLPLGFMGYALATRTFLLFNIFLVLVSIVLGWRVHINHKKDKQQLWLFSLGVVLFPSTILAIYVGQVNLLVLAGLISFLWLAANNHDLSAGVALSLTMIKPHLIYLALPIIILAVILEKRWKILAGFGSALLFSLLVVFAFRPSFILECLTMTAGGNLFGWQTPTLTTFLHVSLDFWWVRISGIILIPMAVLLWWRYRDRTSFLIIVDLAVIASIITSPFGWSYDFVVLLLPMMHIWSWLLSAKLTRLEATLIMGIIIALYVIYYYQRVASPNEMYFFWLPLIVACLYLWTFMRSRDRKLDLAIV